MVLNILTYYPLRQGVRECARYHHRFRRGLGTANQTPEIPLPQLDVGGDGTPLLYMLHSSTWVEMVRLPWAYGYFLFSYHISVYIR